MPVDVGVFHDQIITRLQGGSERFEFRVHVYHKVSVGGYVIVDDYAAIPACAKGTDDFRLETGITDPLQEVDWAAVYWRKT